MARRLLFEGSARWGWKLRAAAERFVVEGNEIVLSSGSIANPQLLMLSGVGPADHLRDMGIPLVHNLPGVGRISAIIR